MSKQSPYMDYSSQSNLYIVQSVLFVDVGWYRNKPLIRHFNLPQHFRTVYNAMAGLI